jgi:hypothetical protein
MRGGWLVLLWLGCLLGALATYWALAWGLWQLVGWLLS